MTESNYIPSPSDIVDVLNYFKEHSYDALDNKRIQFLKLCLGQCKKILLKDYKFFILDNQEGELCSHYPSEILIPTEAVTTVTPQVLRNQMAIADKLVDSGEYFMKGRLARCRGRFVVPAILFEDKYICRSAALSSSPEMYGRVGLNLLFPSVTKPTTRPHSSSVEENGQNGFTQPPQESTVDFQMVEKKRKTDISILDLLDVSYICDLMVEQKKGGYGIYFASSEKADKEGRYGKFDILSMPCPGCELYQQYGRLAYSEENMFYNWNLPRNNATFTLPPNIYSLSSALNIDWSQYKTWNISQMTENYLQLLLVCLIKGDRGMLIHCISGWDRTPLFIGLIRMSLWADNQIHWSLTPLEILYFTLTYDWMLFGHQFEDRLQRSEEILFFGFNFLRHLENHKFSYKHLSMLQLDSEETIAHGNKLENADAIETDRAKKLREVREVFISAYGSSVGLNYGEQIQPTRGLFPKSVSNFFQRMNLWSTRPSSSV